MMFYPSRDGFLTQLQESGQATATTTGADDLAIAIPAIIDHAATIGVRVRIHASAPAAGVSGCHLTVWAREDTPSASGEREAT
jgi:hypothetical protein